MTGHAPRRTTPLRVELGLSAPVVVVTFWAPHPCERHGFYMEDAKVYGLNCEARPAP